MLSRKEIIMEIKTNIKSGYDYDFELASIPDEIAIPW